MRRFVTAALLAGYGLVLAYLTLSPQSPQRLAAASRLRLYPFQTILDCWSRGGWVLVVNILGNLAAFVPLGLLWPILRRGRTGAWRVGLLGAGVSLAIELIQFATARRIADVDDVLLNALGALLGYGVYTLAVAGARRFVRHVSSRPDEAGARRGNDGDVGPLTSRAHPAERAPGLGQSSRRR